jgi:hypothetical protein
MYMTIYDATYKRIIVVFCQAPSTTAVLVMVFLVIVHPVVPARHEPEAVAPPISLSVLPSMAGATAPHQRTQGRELDSGRLDWSSET